MTGEDGRSLLKSLAAASPRAGVDLARAIQDLPRLELVMPRGIDRLSWAGDGRIWVVGTVRSLDERMRMAPVEQAFDTAGVSHSVVTAGYVSNPYLVLRPVTGDFGLDPEAIRRASPPQARSTISTSREEREALTVVDPPGSSRNPLTAASSTRQLPIGNALAPDYVHTESGMIEGGPSTSGGVPLPSAMSWEWCTTITETYDPNFGSLYPDRDFDGIREDCEAFLWNRFSPWLRISSLDRAAGREREPYFSVSLHPYTSRRIQIVYALGYYRDPGDPVLSLESHDGDSEFIIVEVAPLGQGPSGYEWGMEYVTFSAHWGSEVNGTRRYYWTSVLPVVLDLSPVSLYRRGRPTVFVAQDKHANYQNKTACQQGGWNGWDRCDDSAYETPVYLGSGLFLGSIGPTEYFDPRPAAVNRNLGNYYRSSNPTPMTILIDATRSSDPSRAGVEAFWSNHDYFAGWISNPGTAGVKAGPYFRVFQAFMF